MQVIIKEVKLNPRVSVSGNPSMVDAYKKWKHLSSLVSGVPRDFRRLLRKQIEDAKAIYLNSYGTNFFTLQLKFGKTLSEVVELDKFPKAEDIRELRTNTFSEIRIKRKALKEVNYEHKDNNGFNYKTAGGVFQKPGSILDLLKSVNTLSRLETSKRPNPKSKANYVGIELELICNAEKSELLRAMLGANLASYVHIKYDSSIRTNPGDHEGYTHEVTVMCRQEEAKSILSRVLNVLKGYNAYVNSSCGTHVHFDMRNRDVAASYQKLFRIQPVLRSLVSVDRLTNSQYCSENTYGSFSESAQLDGRYKTINTQVYKKYKTLEVRILNGTLSLAKLVNWIGLVTTVLDDVTIPRMCYTSTDLQANYPSMNTKLLEYIEKRSNDVMTHKITTDIDHTTYNYYEMAV